MGELVFEAMIEQRDIEIFGGIKDEVEIAETVEGTHADILIVLGDSNKHPPQCGTLLHRYPELKFLALASEPDKAGILGTLRRKNVYAGG
jgi:hypothetical protein